MTDLFSGQEAPLADRMRPRTLAEFIGQRHLLGEGRLLLRAARLRQNDPRVDYRQ